MTDILLSPIRLNELEILIENSVQRALNKISSKNVSPETDKMLTIDEAADYLHLSKQTVYQRVSNSTIPHSKAGNRLYFSKDDLTNWIKAGRRQTIAEIEANA